MRRAILCGIDHYSDVNYERRRYWLEEKLLDAAEILEIFAIKLCGDAQLRPFRAACTHRFGGLMV
ncbi:MAG: hypothetical protein AAF431_05300 [Pseudomonadota bacterium]